MGWADNYIKRLRSGETIKFRPRGHSMTGLINDGDLVTVEPRPAGTKVYPAMGTAVLCKVKGKQYLHKAIAFDAVNGYVQIANNKGFINGWTKIENVYGVVTSVEP